MTSGGSSSFLRHNQKMRLVPYDAETVAVPARSLPPPLPTTHKAAQEQQISDLDVAMRLILDNASLPTSVKLARYAQQLRNYVSARRELDSPELVRLSEMPDDSISYRPPSLDPPSFQIPMSIAYAVSQMPRARREVAEKILHKLRLPVTPEGEIVDSEGRVIRGSDLARILDYHVRSDQWRRARPEPYAYKHFLSALPVRGVRPAIPQPWHTTPVPTQAQDEDANRKSATRSAQSFASAQSDFYNAGSEDDEADVDDTWSTTPQRRASGKPRRRAATVKQRQEASPSQTPTGRVRPAHLRQHITKPQRYRGTGRFRIQFYT
jgi:hypothetical protein